MKKYKLYFDKNTLIMVENEERESNVKEIESRERREKVTWMREKVT